MAAKRGRPPGPSPKGEATRARLYQVALAKFAADGFEDTTMRAIARAAGVSPGLMYRYFPSKRAVVMALYDALSAEYAARTLASADGPWAERGVAALRTSLAVLAPHRDTLSALIPVLVSRGDQGLFAPATAFSRERVQGAFVAAVQGAVDAPPPETAAALGRLLYLAHLGVLLLWLLDRSPDQSATHRLIDALAAGAGWAGLAARLPMARRAIATADALLTEALVGDAATAR